MGPMQQSFLVYTIAVEICHKEDYFRERAAFCVRQWRGTKSSAGARGTAVFSVRSQKTKSPISRESH